MRQVTHALLTRPPLSHPSVRKLPNASFDLHVLSTPPAFILSQDQTLILKCLFPGFSQACWLKKKIHTLLGFCSSELILRIVQGWSCCSVIKVHFAVFRAVLGDSLFIISQRFPFVNNFFKVFSKKFFILNELLFWKAK